MGNKIKIIYIYLGGDLTRNLPGVQNKIISKIKYLNSNKSICQGISVINKDSKNEIIELPNIKFLEITSSTKRKYFNSIKSNKSVFTVLSEYLQSIRNEFDFIIFRYPLASKFLLEFCEQFPQKVILEHNTLEVPELKLNFKNLVSGTKFSFKPGYFINILENGIFPIFREYYYRKKIERKNFFKIAVSHEIAKLYSKSYSTKEILVISNAIDTYLFGKRKLFYNPKDVINLFMLVGFKADWHGIERLIKSIQKYEGQQKLIFNFIGVTKTDFQTDFNKENIEINFFDSLSSNELDFQLINFHIGIGTLEAYKKNMFEASPLKVREYFARGFPVIIGYEDTDLMDSILINDFVFRVENNSSLIDFNEVVKWYMALSKIENFPSKIQDFAREKLDTSVKMNKLIDVLIEKSNGSSYN
jgi:hypothetical protein